MIADFVRGFGFGLRGAAHVLRRPRLWRLLALPFVVSLLALIALVAAALSWHGALVDWVAPGGALGDVIRPLVAAAAYLALLLAVVFLFAPIASAISGPFNEELAQAIEHERTGEPAPPFSLGRLLVDLGKTVAHESRRFLRWVLLAGAVLLASVILPGVGAVIGLVGGGLVASRFAGWDALDATTSRWGWSYQRKLAFLRERRALVLGLGAFVTVVLFVPVLGALAPPLGAAGGVLLLLDSDAKRA